MAARDNSWHECWASGRAGWHQPHVNKTLVKYYHNLATSPGSKILVPLCGKTLDLKYLYDLNHVVVGIELVEKPIIDFFTEHGLEYSRVELPRLNGAAYVSRDGRLQLFCCSFFNFDVDCAGQFDAIWDRCSLSAVEINDRSKYCQVMKTLMKIDCNYLLEILHYDASYRNIPPYSMDLEELQQHVGSDVAVDILEHDHYKRANHSGYGPWMSKYNLLLKRKNT